MKSKKLYEAMNYVDDWYLDIADTPVKEHPTMKRKHFSAKKAITYALAAAICISLLTVTAAATGLIPGIFKTLQEQVPEEKELFQAAAKASTEQVPEVVDLPKLDMSKLTLFERYYDGETILIGYDMESITPEPVVGYEPDPELLGYIKQMPEFEHTPYPGMKEDTVDERLELGIMSQSEYDKILAARSKYAQKHDLRGYWNIYMDQMLREELSEDQFNTFWNIMEEKGACCVVFRDVWLGDHKYINGVDVITAMSFEAGYTGISEYDTENGKCLKINPLPESALSKDAVILDMEVRSAYSYWYMELDGYVYQASKHDQKQTVSFVLENVKN